MNPHQIILVSLLLVVALGIVCMALNNILKAIEVQTVLQKETRDLLRQLLEKKDSQTDRP